MPIDTTIKVLVIEDNAGDFFLVQEYLATASQFIITQANTLAVARQLLNTQQFDVVLLDLSLPDNFGVSAVQSLIQINCAVPIIVLTGASERQFGIDSLKSGAEDYLAKDDINASLLVKSIRYSIERSRVRKMMNRQDRLFRVIMENSVDAKILIDKKGNINFVTASIKSITGYDSNDRIGDNIISLVHPDDVQKLSANIFDVLVNPAHYSTFEIRLLHKDGRYIWCKKSIVNLLQDDQVKSLVCTFWDISKEKESEAILKVSEERYRYLFNNNPACIFIWYLDDFKIAKVNDAAVQQYRCSREALLQKTVLDFRSSGDVNQIREFAKLALDDKHFYCTLIWTFLPDDGEEIFMQISSQRIDFNNRPAIMGIGINVTEKRALQKKLQEEKLKKDREITEAVIQAQEKERKEIGLELHDNINQILASSRLYLGLVKSDNPFIYDSIHKTDKLITTAINEIRELSHALIPPSLQENNFNDALDNIIEVTQTGSGLVIDKQMHGFDQQLISDELRLTIYRIIQEQFTNILKYANADSVTLQLIQTPGKILLSIKDNGKGIGETPTTGGVGLLNIKTRAALHNGTLNIISAPGKGFELRVTFNDGQSNFN